MTLVLTLLMLFFALIFLAVDSLKKERRQKRIALYIGIRTLKPESFLNRVIFHFGSEHRQELENKLIEAGYYNTEWAKFYFPAKVVFVILFTGMLFFLEISSSNKLIFATIFLLLVIVLPDFVLQLRRKIIIINTSSKLPYLLDMMSVCVQTGMTIEAALAYLSKELASFDSDLCYQIKKTSDSAKIHGLEKALNDLSVRLPTPSVQSFVLTIIQNLQYGTSVAQVLSELAEDMRKVQILSVEEKVGKLSAKMSVPLILLIMFPIVILILAPAVMRMSIEMGG